MSARLSLENFAIQLMVDFHTLGVRQQPLGYQGLRTSQCRFSSLISTPLRLSAEHMIQHSPLSLE